MSVVETAEMVLAASLFRPEMSPLSIRKLAEADLAALLALYRELHPGDAPLPEAAQVADVWRTILADPRQHCLGGFLDERLVCSCTLVIIPNLTRGGRPYALIENVVTTAAHRGRGYGRAILAHACNIAWQHDCYKVMLQTGRKDDATLAFYESAGFDRTTKQAFYAAAPT
ncbi:GNAT family N-acetyltransferase [Uliginosibacterium sp. 31-16]|uniref:GNAT family N-acetyltransferase n=1 Tax=Uliginosibacterium sp. 31-16 TaxID=3068315 RepID=UPI00273E0455|nr:GNAT family N-acetyltransferase [Uliginosibacterium sp. 31-16]MDP5238962.1 GNAT family N-acetyltransferase [Uliginosibacterium sp. 31-16]